MFRKLIPILRLQRNPNPCRPVERSIRFCIEELESRAVFSQVGGSISLTATGNPLPAARMTLFTSDVSYFREARSNSTGAYQFDNVPNGTFRLGVAGKGYEYEELSITVNGSSVAVSFQLEPETQPGRWSFIGDIAPEILGGTGTATLLANGQEVLVCHDTEDPVIVNFVTGQKRYPPSSGREAHGHATTLLTDGRVFFAGGGDGIGGGPQGANPALLRQSKVYNPSTNSWTNLPDMIVPRWYPSIVRLPDERLLVFAGDTGSGRTNSAEIFDIRTNTWTLVGNFRRPQDMPPSLLLYTGEVLKTWRDPELFNLRTNSWRDAAPLLQGRAGASIGQHSDHMSVMLPDGRVLVLGIDPLNPNPSFTEIYDPVGNTWSLGASPAIMRQRPEAMLLPGGKVLAYGGEYTGTLPAPVPLGTAGSIQNVTNVSDLYDPVTGSWRRLANMNRFIHYHNVGVLLPDGRVLDTGGAGSGGPFGQDQRVEAFEPPYLFRGIRPRIDSLSTADLKVGATLTMDVSRTSQVTEIVMIGTRATTHWIDGGTNRYLSLDYTQSGTTIQATIPDDRVRALPGWYLLIAMVDDIPSEAKIVRVAPTIDGDFNDDAVYDCRDINALVAAIAADGNNQAFDLTGDAAVDGQDLNAWLAEAGEANLASGNPYLPGDANLDGVVDGSDFNIWNANKFTNLAQWCAGDFNADGTIDGPDFNLWNAFKFQSSDAEKEIPTAVRDRAISAFNFPRNALRAGPNMELPLSVELAMHQDASRSTDAAPFLGNDSNFKSPRFDVVNVRWHLSRPIRIARPGNSPLAESSSIRTLHEPWQAAKDWAFGGRKDESQ